MPAIGTAATVGTGMVGGESGKSGEFGVHLGVFANQRVAGGDGLDLGVGQHDFGVEVLDGAHGVGGVERAVIWAMNRALRSTVPHMYGSKLPVGHVADDVHHRVLVALAQDATSRCSMSAGRHGTSTWWRATRRCCTLMPVPIFSVEPMSTSTSP